MKRVVVGASGALAIVLVAAGCGGADKKGAQSSAQGGGGAATVAVKDSKLGKILVDGSGNTLYLFLKDKGTTSSCSGPCAGVWPPLTTSGKPEPGGGASAQELGSTSRTDGKTQVTYHGHPLYHYEADGAPGDTAGQGLDQFGAEWYVLSAQGNKLEKEGS